MPVVEKAFEGARLNPTKTTYVRTWTCIFFFGFSPPFVLHCAFVLHCVVLMVWGWIPLKPLMSGLVYFQHHRQKKNTDIGLLSICLVCSFVGKKFLTILFRKICNWSKSKWCLGSLGFFFVSLDASLMDPHEEERKRTKWKRCWFWSTTGLMVH